MRHDDEEMILDSNSTRSRLLEMLVLSTLLLCIIASVASVVQDCEAFF
jgi:hypothetical protein